MMMMNDISKESAFLVTNSSGRHINLLNDNEAAAAAHQQQHQQRNFTAPSPPLSEVSDEANPHNNDSNNLKRKYHCTEPGCTKSFTTSGHLARHNRIHTGEKNFPCLFPGCQSRFSRQDNMMQHYRTHMSPKSRRTQKKIMSEDLHPRPRLHAHQRIRSDPYQVERPLTIDQHLNNYRRSLLSHPSSGANRGVATSVRYNMPTPLGSVAATLLQKQQQQQQQQQQQPWPINQVDSEDSSIGSKSATPPIATPSPPIPDMMFYQHKPLTFSREANKVKSSLPFTLLHPTQILPPIVTYPIAEPQHIREEDGITPSLSSSSTSTSATANTASTSSSEAGLLQLANIVSTFG